MQCGAVRLGVCCEYVSVVSATINMNVMRVASLSLHIESVSVVSAEIIMSAMRGERLSL